MWEWLLSPIDPSRAHMVGWEVSWHGRLMVFAWGVLAPIAVLVARFFKIVPGQDWPRELDSQVWWRSHWIGQSLVFVLTIFGFGVIYNAAQVSAQHPHRVLGYAVLACLIIQITMGVTRGSKGGPTAPAADGTPRGHHYDMTPWRIGFEHLHKALGYLTLLCAAAAVLTGIWMANAPMWMWIAITGWWAIYLLAFAGLQGAGRAIDTYQAIWGPDPSHPGNQRKAPGWGMRRPGDALPLEARDKERDGQPAE